MSLVRIIKKKINKKCRINGLGNDTFPKLTFLCFGKVINDSSRGNCLEAIIPKPNKAILNPTN